MKKEDKRLNEMQKKWGPSADSGIVSTASPNPRPAFRPTRSSHQYPGAYAVEGPDPTLETSGGDYTTAGTAPGPLPSVDSALPPPNSNAMMEPVTAHLVQGSEEAMEAVQEQFEQLQGVLNRVLQERQNVPVGVVIPDPIANVEDQSPNERDDDKEPQPPRCSKRFIAWLKTPKGKWISAGVVVVTIVCVVVPVALFYRRKDFSSYLSSLSTDAESIFFSGKLTGTIPSQIGSYTNLDALYLCCNELTGPIPSEIGLLTKLTYVSLSYNQLTGVIPSEIGLLTRLTDLSLYNNNFSGEFMCPDFIEDCQISCSSYTTVCRYAKFT